MLRGPVERLENRIRAVINENLRGPVDDRVIAGELKMMLLDLYADADAAARALRDRASSRPIPILPLTG